MVASEKGYGTKALYIFLQGKGTYSARQHWLSEHFAHAEHALALQVQACQMR